MLALLAAAAALRAETPSATPAAPAKTEPAAAAVKADQPDAATDDEPAPSVTAHTVTVNGKVLKYHATAGYLLLKEEDKSTGADDKEKDKADPTKKPNRDNLKPKAKVFFTAYTLDGVADPATRPLMFVFNGGPGSASMWLHLGAIAPRRAALTDEGEAPPPPYRVVDNEATWLDRTDLVFIDPVSTGYSRPAPKENANQFHGLREDIASVGDFIRLYTSRHTRWLSPKFILGESYGTTRAAGLADYLQNTAGYYLNGLILVSTVINFQTLNFTPQNNEPFVGFLPTYAATAWYHRKLSADLHAKSLAEVAALARAFAGGAYTLALARGDTLPAAEQQRVAAELQRFTGIPTAFWLQRKLRLPDFLYFNRQLQDEGKVVGRLDSRFTGLRYDPGTETYEYDPATEAVLGPLSAAFNDYVRRELKVETDLPYHAFANVNPWNFGDAANGHPNTAEDLRKAMTRNPYLKVWVTAAYYDLATPFYAAENSVALMNLAPAIRANLHFTYYEAGHMHYIHRPSRAKFKADFEAFLQEALDQQPVPATAR
ncbi:MAG: peptidase S10 [Opitutae bacterium]|nr:peptidase S10 [Opitutae bacterium]